MNLKCKINGKEYKLLVQGNTFSDEYNETLDSGNIILAHINKTKKLKPFDDVFIYDNEFFGYNSYGQVQGNNKFYKHLLVDSYTEEFVNIKDRVYKYKIALMSETKALEKIQCPNISITQPLNANKKVSVWEYLNRYVKMYSPKFKKVNNKSVKTWRYTQKYIVDPELEKIFGNVYSPDFSLNAPTLRDILSKLMIVKDMIPYVENDIIKAMDITQRKNKINLEDLPCTNIISSMRSQEYCDALRRNYSDGLSQDSTCQSVEYLGFRNSDNALMTLENMRLETRFPIYKINKMYLCYYKESEITNVSENNEYVNYCFLCKHDITPLVKLNTERNALSQDWDKFRYETPENIEELAKYKLSTLGYDIGSNIITGWGTSYSYPKGWWQEERNTYLENIIRILDSIDRNGINNVDYLIKDIENQDSLRIVDKGNIFKTIITPFSRGTIENENWFIKQEDVASALDMKGLFFEIEYQGFFNGAVIHSKDNALDNIVSNDNSSSSLALLELDGLSQKEKVNRLGNKTYQFTIRYDEYNDLSNLLNLGDYFSNEEEDDIIIYHREIAIYDNYVLATYFAAKDYVLKNYYTSVYARHRTWNLIPYGESVTRAENRKMFLNLSKKENYYENERTLNFDNFNYNNLISFAKNSGKVSFVDVYDKSNKINNGYISSYTKDYDENGEYLGTSSQKYFLSDINTFNVGYSLCFNIRMFDNISMGTYISKENPFVDNYYGNTLWQDIARSFLDTNNDYSGSNVSLYKIVEDDETGFIEKMEISFFNYDSKNIYKETLQPLDVNFVFDIYNNRLLKLPQIIFPPTIVNNITNKISTNKENNLFEIYKDNKEKIDMTFQIEPITTDKDILFSSWFMKLNDMLSNFYKVDETYSYSYKDSPNVAFLKGRLDFCILANTYITDDMIGNSVQTYPQIYLFFDTIQLERFKELRVEFPLEPLVQENIKEFSFDKGNIENYAIYDCVAYLKIKFLNLISSYEYYDNDGDYLREEITYKVEQTVGFIRSLSNGGNGEIEYITTIEKYIFKHDVHIENQFEQINGIDEFVQTNIEGKKVFKLSLSEIHTVDKGQDKTFNVQSSVFTLDNDKRQPNYETNLNADILWDFDFFKTYYKNMYLVLSTEKLKNTLVYDSYKINNFPNSSYILYDIPMNNFIEPITDKNGTYININKKEFDKYFVFNNRITFSQINANDWQEESNLKYKIYNLEFDSNGEHFNSIKITHYINNDYYFIEYGNSSTQEFKFIYNSINSHWSSNNYKVLKFNENTNNEWIVNNGLILGSNNVQSIQYWFMNETQENFEDNLLNFVFGVNLTEEDKEKDEIRVYASLVSNRDSRVYDEYHNVVGNVTNYLDENNEKTYGNEQYYSDIIE